MSDEPAHREPSSTPTPRSHRYRAHELQLGDGGRLVLGVDGVIRHLDADGATTQSWAPADPAWPDQAIRFGLRPEAQTVAPQGTRVQPTRPPR
jgi:hypothetical protein